jgi:hypothetical protein
MKLNSVLRPLGELSNIHKNIQNYTIILNKSISYYIIKVKNKSIASADAKKKQANSCWLVKLHS